MENFFKLIAAQMSDFWKGMEAESRKRLLVIISLLLIVVIAFSYFVVRKEYTVLYSNLDSKEAGEILNKLENMKMDVKPEGNGTILVLKNQEPRIRMQLAAEGYPKSGHHYDSETNSLGMGATDFDKRKAERTELQRRLESAIGTMDGVQEVIVTISLPNQDSFVLKEDKQPATASVLLNIGTDRLSAKQIKGIEELVAKSVLGLKPENISIVDTNMNALNHSDINGVDSVNTHFDMENEVRGSLERQIYNLLDPVFGKGNVVASINVKLNFDKETSEVVRFEPVTDDAGIAVSINELKEEVTSSGTAGGQVQYANDLGGQDGGYEKTNRTINYEVNQIKEKIERAQGRLEQLTLSILINNNGLDGDTLNTVQKIVSTAIGVDQDKVSVNGMSFEGRKADLEELQKRIQESEQEVKNKRLIDLIKYIVYGLAAFLILFLIYQLIRKLKLPVRQEPQAARGRLNERVAEEVVEMPETDKEQIMQKKRIDTLIDTKPEIAAQQIRNWLNEE